MRKSGEPFTAALRGISGAKRGDTIRIGMPEPFVHLFDEIGLAIGAREDWRVGLPHLICNTTWVASDAEGLITPTEPPPRARVLAA